MSDIELRELHQMYWVLNKENAETFPIRNFKEFSTFLRGAEDRYRVCFIGFLRSRYREFIGKEVPKGMRVLEKYLQPKPE